MPADGAKNGLIGELARRGVFQAVAIYVAVAWGGTEILITASDRFGWPAWIADAALVLFLTGLPFVVLLSWTFDLSGTHLRRVDPGSMRGKLMIATAATVVMAITATVIVWRGGDTEIAKEPVIAVLPMQDFTGADGGAIRALSFTGELIHRISVHPDLMALDLRTVTNPAVANLQQGNAQEKLGADYFVQGSLNPARGGTQIRARMTDASGLVVWEDETVRDLGDQVEARAAQAEIAGHIAAALGTTLTGVDYCEPSTDGEAVAAYYEGWQLYNQRSGVGIAAAARALEKAIEIDPDYARALTDLASVYQRFGFWLAEDPTPYFADRQSFDAFLDEAPGKIWDLSKRAIERCPSLGVAYLNYEFARTIADQRAVYDEALRREPDNGILLNDSINFLRTYGHIDLAAEYARRAYRKDPLNPRAAHLLSSQLHYRGDIEESIEMEIEARELGYSARVTNTFLAFYYASLGDAERLDRHMAESWPDGFVADPIMPFDPRRFILARNDEAARDALIVEFDRVLPELDGTNTERHLRWAKLLDDEALVWRYLEHFAAGSRERGDAWIAHQTWQDDWRARLAGDRLLDLMGWRDEYGKYWDVYGPPDGCEWDGVSLDCSAG